MKSIIIVFLLLTNSSSFAQKDKDIYLIFKNGIKDSCQYSPYRDGRNKKNINFEHKYKLGYYVFLNEYFKLVPETKIEKISKTEVRKLNIVTIDYFLREREKTEKAQLANPNDLFKNIYILIRQETGDYLRYKVKWQEVFID